MKTPTLETRDLVLMQALDEHGGVTRAAAELGLTQSAVSHHLARLQEKLGSQLVQRRGRGLELTSRGKELARQSRRMLRQLATLERALHETSRLAVCTQCHTAYDWLAPVLSRFEAMHPATRLDIRVDHTRDPIAGLRQHAVDLALCHAAPGPGLLAHDLVVDPFVAVLPAHHAAATGPSIRGDDLGDLPVLVHDLPAHDLREVGALLFGDRLPERVMRLPLTDAMLQLVAHGYGVAVMPGLAARTAEERYPVAVRPFAKHGAERRWRAVTRAEDEERADLQALLACLKAWFQRPR